jgi:hypothetical protein
MIRARQIRRSRPVAASGNNRSTRTAEGMSDATRLPGSLSAIPGRHQRRGLRCAASEWQKFLAPRLEVGPADDVYEREADQVADRVVADETALPLPAVAPVSRGTSQAGPQASGRNGAAGTPASVAQHAATAVATGGQALGATERAFFEPRFGRDLSDVHIHTGPKADRAARAIGAEAYTYGTDIAFASGHFAPEKREGARLLAHEITHVMQQTGGDNTIRRQSASGGSDEVKATDFSKIEMLYNGEELIVSGDGTELFRYNADSGRPIRITREHAQECGADARVDTYLNDARFTGIKDMGPIPAGVYTLSPPRIEEYSAGEQTDLLLSGIFGADKVTIGGRSVHSGDWGAGRVHLNPVRTEPGPCGNVSRRSAFFLHGGLLRGSSGCIDIQTEFDALAAFLDGYRRNVTLTVDYTEGPSRVGFWTGLGGALAYGGFHFRHGPTARLGVEHAGGDTRFVASAEYSAILDWAGGMLGAGLHLDVPMDDSDAFVRAGLRGSAEFLVLQALYGRVFGGGYYETAHHGEEAGFGAQVGGGLSYDFGPVQLEALYNFLQPLGDEEPALGAEEARQRQQAHQVLIGAGFKW